jgi:DNA replication protein DnaC
MSESATKAQQEAGSASADLDAIRNLTSEARERVAAERRTSRQQDSGGASAARSGAERATRRPRYAVAAAPSRVQMDVQQEPYTCGRCRNDFKVTVVYRLEYDPATPDAEPARRPWAEEAFRPPQNCPDCAAELEHEAEAEREAQERAARMSVDNIEYIRRLKAAGIHEAKLWRATLRNYDASESPESLASARSFVQAALDGRAEVRPWRYYNGPTGSGKSHLIVGIDRALYAMGYRGKVALIVAPLFVKRVQAGYADNSSDALINSVLEADVVLVDDLGRGPQHDNKAQIMNEMLCLLAGKAVAISSNYTRDGLELRNGEYMTLASRLGPASCVGVALTGRDRREDVA